MKKYLPYIVITFVLLGYLFIPKSKVDNLAGVQPYLTIQGGSGTTTPSGILYGDNGATSHLNTVKIGSNLNFTNGTLSATGGSSSSFGQSWEIANGIYNASVLAPTTTIPFYVSSQGTSTVANLSGVYDASAFSGSDICAKVNSAYAAAPVRAVIITIPRGDFTCATAIAFTTLGKRALLMGTPAEGTILRYTGTGAFITINTGVQNTGVNHTTGNGLYGLYLQGNNYSESSPQVGVVIGGGAATGEGCDGCVLDAVNIFHFGYGLETKGGAYHFLYENGTIRDNGQNVHIDTPQNSGESMDFINAFIVDGANNDATDCFFVDNSGAASINVTGGSFDDCQVNVLQAVSYTETGVHHENPGYAAWGKYTFLLAGNNAVNNTAIIGSTFYQDAITSGNAPDQFIQGGGVITLSGVNFIKNSGSAVAITNAVALLSTGKLVWNGITNGRTIMTNVVAGYPYSVSGTTATTTPSSIEILKSGSGVVGPELRLTNSADTVQDKYLISIYDNQSASPYRSALQWTIGNTGLGQLDIFGGFGSTLSGLTNLATFMTTGVGISSTTPGSLFSIGTTNGINFSTATSSFNSTGGINLNAGCFSISGTCISGTSGSGTIGSGTTGQHPYYAANGTTLTATSTIFLATTGNVGIATTVPLSTLDVAGTGLRASGVFDQTTTNYGLYAGFNTSPRVGFFNGTAAQNWQIDNNGGIFRWFLPGVVHMSLSATTGLALPDTTSGVIVASGTGNSSFAGKLGIATTTPAYPLNPFSASGAQLALSGGAGISQWVMRNAGGNLYLASTAVSGIATTTATALTLNGSNGYLGINMTTPGFIIHTAESTGIGATTTLKIANTTGGVGVGDNYASRLLLSLSGTPSSVTVGGIVAAARTNAVNSGDTDMTFAVSLGTAMTDRMIIKSSGNVGFGTSTPLALVSSYTSASSTNALFEAVNGKGGCFIMQDTGATPTTYTQVYSKAGVLYSKVATSLSTCN